MTTKVLMVCLGNICRSPMAEGALRLHSDRLGLRVEVDSAGTGDWHIGHPPDPRSVEVAKRLGGVDIRELRARQISVSDFYDFDYIVAMDMSNLRHLQAMAPVDAPAQLSLLLECLSGQASTSVPDPYYGAIVDFEIVWQMVDAATAAFAESIA